MATPDDGRESGSLTGAIEATYVLDQEMLVHAHRSLYASQIRLAGLAIVVLIGVCIVLIVFRGASMGTTLLLLAAITLGAGLPHATARHLGQTVARATQGAGGLRISLTIRPDGLQIGAGDATRVIGWPHLTETQRSSDYLLISSPASGGIVAPRAALSPQFEATLQRMLQTAGSSAPTAETKAPLALWLLRALFALSVLFLFIGIAIAVAYGRPRSESIVTCPEGQIAIVSQGSDGSLATRCR